METKLSGQRGAAPLRILMLERGTWWTTPVETVQDKQVKTRDFLIRKGQPTQEWSSLNDYRGMFDLVRRCRYSATRPQGLYDFSPIGKHGLFSLENDGVSVLRASGVGGGSLSTRRSSSGRQRLSSMTRAGRAPGAADPAPRCAGPTTSAPSKRCRTAWRP
jgi:hypothetical protein